MKIKVKDLKKIVKEVVQEAAAASSSLIGLTSDNPKSQSDDGNWVFDLEFGEEFAEIEVYPNPWVEGSDPSTGAPEDWEAEVVGAKVYDVDGNEVWVDGETFLNMLTPEQAGELEALVWERISRPVDDY